MTVWQQTQKYLRCGGIGIPKAADEVLRNGLLVKTGDTMLEITETYTGKVRIGDRLKDYE